MAGKNAFFDGSTVQREPQVWAPIVHGIDMFTPGKQRQRVFFDMDNYTLSALQVSKLAHAHISSAELWCRCVSGHRFHLHYMQLLLLNLRMVVKESLQLF